MRSCESCGSEVSGRRKKCPECKRAEHAQAERARRDAARERVAGIERPDPAEVTEVPQTGRAVPGSRWQFRTPYAPRPAGTSPEPVDYLTGDSSPTGGRPRNPDLTGISNAVRQDRVQYEQAVIRAEIGAEDESDMMTWGDLMQRNNRPDDGRTVVFDKPAPGSPQRQARPDEGRSLSSMLSTGREPNVDYLGRSTRRPRSWR